MQEPTTLRIETVDGREHLFEFTNESEINGEYTIRSKVEKLLTQQSIALAVDDRLLILPLLQIVSIEVFPLMKKLPEAAVPQVTAMSASRCTAAQYA